MTERLRRYAAIASALPFGELTGSHRIRSAAVLSHVVKTRGSAPTTAEPGFVIEHREALIYMICEAAELEHLLMCEYLFAAFSLKDQPDATLSAE